MSETLTTIKTRVPETDRERLEEWAAEERWSLSQLLRVIVEMALEDRPAKPQVQT